MGRGDTKPPLDETWGDPPGLLVDEFDEGGDEVIAEVKRPKGLGRPGQRARPYRACCCWCAAIRACNCCASKGADDLLGVVEVDEANIILTAILAFSAIKLLFCSLLAASEAVVAVAEAAANKGELRNSNAAVEGSNRPGCGGGPPGPPGNPIRPI